jgi:hypothetical protein
MVVWSREQRRRWWCLENDDSKSNILIIKYKTKIDYLKPIYYVLNNG